MIALDTNVLVRLMAADDSRQVDQVRRFMAARSARQPAYVSAVVLAEATWVLRRRLKYPAKLIQGAIRQLLESEEIRIEHHDRLATLLASAGQEGVDLVDHLIAWSAAAAGCTHTVTFDRRAAKKVPQMELLA